MSEINVVPYIDVMLVLLIIFMVTAPLLTQGVKVDLPIASSEPVDDPEEPFVLTVNKQGEYFVNDDETAVESLNEIRVKAQAVLRSNASLSFLVRGDGEVNYQFVIDAISMLREAGVPSVGLVTKDPGEQ
ncbi:MAG: biopolymer transport protein TolR [Gammaproteobacteria bacterium]|jgi:biopolymer transport protein TolR